MCNSPVRDRITKIIVFFLLTIREKTNATMLIGHAGQKQVKIVKKM